DVWKALREGLRVKSGWGDAGAAADLLQMLMDRIRSGHELVLATTTHQAKGLEWPAVDYITNLDPGVEYRLDQDNQNDRYKYVALTRAQDRVRVRPLPPRVL